LNYNLVKNLC